MIDSYKIEGDGDEAALEQLSEHHRRMLVEESAISPTVIAARDYKTITDAAELIAAGFASYQVRVSGLLIPRHWPGVPPDPHQFRPDHPRVRNGKEVKYETPSGARNMLDVHPWNARYLGDPSVELWITEGTKKADALTSRGACTIALSGVWNWKGTNPAGGKTALPDWNDVALNGRRVFLAFDSDVSSKPQVQLALNALSGWLQSKGAVLSIVCWSGHE